MNITIIVGRETNGSFGIQTAWTNADIDMYATGWANELASAYGTYEEVRLISAYIDPDTIASAFATTNAGAIA